MDVKEAAEKIKGIPGAVAKLRSLFAQFSDEAVKLSDLKLKDGSTISVSGDAPAIGADVTVTTDTGAVPAPDGEYEVEDGSLITVLGGKITEIENAAEEKKEEEIPMGSDVVKKLSDRLDAIEAKLGSGDAAMKAENEKLKAELKAHKQIAKETFSLVEALANLPAEKSVEEKSKVDFTKEDRINQLSDTLKKLKNK